MESEGRLLGANKWPDVEWADEWRCHRTDSCSGSDGESAALRQVGGAGTAWIEFTPPHTMTLSAWLLRLCNFILRSNPLLTEEQRESVESVKTQLLSA